MFHRVNINPNTIDKLLLPCKDDPINDTEYLKIFIDNIPKNYFYISDLLYLSSALKNNSLSSNTELLKQFFIYILENYVYAKDFLLTNKSILKEPRSFRFHNAINHINYNEMLSYRNSQYLIFTFDINTISLLKTENIDDIINMYSKFHSGKYPELDEPQCFRFNYYFVYHHYMISVHCSSYEYQKCCNGINTHQYAENFLNKITFFNSDFLKQLNLI